MIFAGAMATPGSVTRIVHVALRRRRPVSSRTMPAPSSATSVPFTAGIESPVRPASPAAVAIERAWSAVWSRSAEPALLDARDCRSM